MVQSLKKGGLVIQLSVCVRHTPAAQLAHDTYSDTPHPPGLCGGCSKKCQLSTSTTPSTLKCAVFLFCFLSVCNQYEHTTHIPFRRSYLNHQCFHVAVMLCDIHWDRRAVGEVYDRWLLLMLSILHRAASQSVRKQEDMLWQPATCSDKQFPAAVERRDEHCGCSCVCVCVFACVDCGVLVRDMEHVYDC